MKKATDYDYQVEDFEEEIEKLCQGSPSKKDQLIDKLADKFLDSILMKKIHPDYFDMQKKCQTHEMELGKLQKQIDAYKDILNNIFNKNCNNEIIKHKDGSNGRQVKMIRYMFYMISPTYLCVIDTTNLDDDFREDYPEIYYTEKEGHNMELIEILDQYIKE